MYKYRIYIQWNSGQVIESLKIIAPTAQDADFIWSTYEGGAKKRKNIEDENRRMRQGEGYLQIKMQCLGLAEEK